MRDIVFALIGMVVLAALFWWVSTIGPSKEWEAWKSCIRMCYAVPAYKEDMRECVLADPDEGYACEVDLAVVHCGCRIPNRE